VVALLGEVASSKTLEAAPVAQESKIPLIATGATNPKVTGKITINPERNADKSAVIITIKNGALHYFGTIEPKST
jgi:ABC-type branched-subunit amino acid transport system substrate-binding protein